MNRILFNKFTRCVPTDRLLQLLRFGDSNKNLWTGHSVGGITRLSFVTKLRWEIFLGHICH